RIMGSCALRFLSESLSLGIRLPLRLTPLLRSENWERSKHWQQCEYLFSMAPGRRRPCLDRGRCRDSQSGTGPIESSVCVARRSFLCTGSHDMRREDFKLKVAPILIRTGSWIAIGSLILPGGTLGEGAVVSAGSVVLKDVPPNCLVRGNPATVVYEIFRGPNPPSPLSQSHACVTSHCHPPDRAAVIDG